MKVNEVHKRTVLVLRTNMTAASIISLDAWYRFVLDKTYDIPMKIKTELIHPIEFLEMDEFGDKDLIKPIEFIEPNLEYDFYTDELIEMERLINPCVIIPQDSFRYSIINILAYCLSEYINDYMEKFTKQSFSYEDGKSCLLIMKNEFLFKRAMTTDGKKHYATVQELQEGHVVPVSESLDIKGIDSLTKSTMNETTRRNLKKILYEDILNIDNIDQIKILKDLAKAEKIIYNSIKEGKKEYYKPVKVKSLSRYENPMRIQGIKASIAYNAIRDEGTEAIDMERRNSLDIVKVNITIKNIEQLKDKHPNTYLKIVELLNQKEFNGSIEAVALPLNVEVPEWLLGFINYTTIINDNISGFPIESVGLYRGNSNNNYTNIVRL